MSDVRDALVDAHRLGRFASVGIVGATVDLMVSSFLVLGPGISPAVAKFVGAEVAIVLMFLINDRWTFLDSAVGGWKSGFKRLLKSNAVRSGGILVQVLVVFVLTRQNVVVVFAGTDIWPILTMPVAIACGFVFNYVGETLLTWRAHR